MTTSSVRTQVIGAAGEVLVQYKLLKHSIDSARMTTDDGIDLVMYLPVSRQAATVQVKAQWDARPAGGKGEPTRGWSFDVNCPAQWLACVDVSRDRVWLFTIDEARELAQEKPASGKWKLYWYTDEANVKGSPRREADMAGSEIETVIRQRLLGESAVVEGNS